MLEADGVHAGYGPILAVAGVSLRIPRGQRAVIVGRNGVGKTALLRTLIGHLPCRRGRIRLDAADVTLLPAHRRVRLGLALVPQGREIFPDLTVHENLRMGGLAAASRQAERLAELLERFPRLRERLAQRAGSLSGGEQQILAVARALMGEPKVLLLDEPTEGVQPSIVEEILEQLLAINQRRGVAMLLVEQNLEFARAFAQRAYTMRRGEIAEELPPEGLDDPRIVDEYLGV